MKPPFEPLVSCCMFFLSMKVAFLVAVTLARRVGKLGATMEDPPFTTFHKDKVFLRLHPKFPPKVIAQFHLNYPILSPAFFPKPHALAEERHLHSLDVRRALTFYLPRTRRIRRSPRLAFLKLGSTVSPGHTDQLFLLPPSASGAQG